MAVRTTIAIIIIIKGNPIPKIEDPPFPEPEGPPPNPRKLGP
jgi:hypothetical protein